LNDLLKFNQSTQFTNCKAVHAHQIGKDRAADTELLNLARRKDRIVITADFYFPRNLAFPYFVLAGFKMRPMVLKWSSKPKASFTPSCLAITKLVQSTNEKS